MIKQKSHADDIPAIGRKPGAVRQALMQALAQGSEGTFDALAVHAGVKPAQAQGVLAELHREGKVQRHGSAKAHAGRGRPRLVYCQASTPPFGWHWELQRSWCASWPCAAL